RALCRPACSSAATGPERSESRRDRSSSERVLPSLPGGPRPLPWPCMLATSCALLAPGYRAPRFDIPAHGQEIGRALVRRNRTAYADKQALIIREGHPLARRRCLRIGAANGASLGLGLVLAALLAAAPRAQAQDYPARTVRVIVPFPAGGTADVMPRIFADWLSRKWGQAVVIENKPGAAGNIGAEFVSHAEPDG